MNQADHPKLNWTSHDSYQACLQGWDLFTMDRGTHRSLEIQRLDDPTGFFHSHGLIPEDVELDYFFDTDDDAEEHVHELAEAGDETCRKALAVLGIPNCNRRSKEA